jgi:hypothetical protein
MNLTAVSHCRLIQSYTVTDLKKETVEAHIHAIYCHKKDRSPSDFKYLVKQV